jgi:threonine synthase
VEKPETFATAIRIGNPASWQGAVAARDESGGLIDSVTDEEITSAYRFIAEREGVFAEPASVAPVAGVIALAKKGFFKEGSRIVITLTGSGLKDPDFALSFEDPVFKVSSTLEAVKEAIR